MKSKLLLAVLSCIVCNFALAAEENSLSERDRLEFSEGKDMSAAFGGTLRPIDDVQTVPAPRFRAVVSCSLFGPAEVQGYRVRCPAGSFLNFRISDGFIPNDHWSLKGKLWDSAPNTAVTTSPGPVINYGGSGRIYNYGGTPQNPRNIDAYLQCSYLHGVDIFPAGSFIALASDAASCTVTPDVRRSRIDRMP